MNICVSRHGSGENSSDGDLHVLSNWNLGCGRRAAAKGVKSGLGDDSGAGEIRLGSTENVRGTEVAGLAVCQLRTHKEIHP